MDQSGPVAQLRRAVKNFTVRHGVDAERWCVALSGGADSLALTAAAVDLRMTVALIVDHGLQDNSADVAETARRQALALGCADARVLRVRVGTAGGPEAAAREARYRALSAARDGAPVLLAHTLDDQ
ncbi:MAG TPA: ATP-binding protein, partial [Mycobacterium sp.]|nr:ATP-binding protein [Mycobacterium sp.]